VWMHAVPIPQPGVHDSRAVLGRPESRKGGHAVDALIVGLVIVAIVGLAIGVGADRLHRRH
jgi:hypothetical protein